jgi:starch synthase (maltosyl-transferring)
MDLSNQDRVVIEQVTPSIDGGRYPIKRTEGERIFVSCAAYKDGHDLVQAQLIASLGTRSVLVPLSYDFNSDKFYGSYCLESLGLWSTHIEAWPDYFGTWARDLKKRLDAGQDIAPELLEGAVLVRLRAQVAERQDREPLENAARALSDPKMDLDLRMRVAFSQTLKELMHGPTALFDVTRSVVQKVRIDRREAGFAAWYELFPRSASNVPGVHGTFKNVEERIPEIAAMGFEVVYLPPIHPIGKVHRKGRNNSTVAQPDDVGSPWAIGSDEGGHTSVHPQLGTLDDFRSLVRTCSEFGLEIALDFALQCAPDHPWVKAHPEWFFVRPDGSIRYAENPPKKYEDIYPLNFWGEKSGGLWQAARDALLFWVSQGVKIFRVDNPHTKPLSFWEWCIDQVQELHPEVIFLSESFTRPNRMKGLAKLGFTQSYTYFTWKNTKAELVDYMTELTKTEMAEYYRPNFFANTPDILHEYLQHGGRPAFRIRLLLAATLAPVYGIYSGYELCENQPVRPGSEEYLDSEKYEIRVRDFNAPSNIKRDVSRINAIRGSEPALHELTNLEFVHTHSDDILAYLKLDERSGKKRHLLTVVNLNPFEARETNVVVPLERLGLSKDAEYQVKDLLTGTTYTWRGAQNYVRLDPSDRVGHVFRFEAARS